VAHFVQSVQVFIGSLYRDEDMKCAVRFRAPL
jgi:hypothetical protein